MSILVAIDNGHGINTPGKRCPDDSMREWQFNHATAKYLEEELARNGFKTLMVSDTKEDTLLSARVAKINNSKADISVSIHANAFQGTYWGDANGIETFAYSKTSKGNTLANLVQKELIDATKLRDRGVKYNRLYMTRKPNCPAILCECGFMDNKKEAELLKSDSYRRLCAIAICKGICKYFGVEYVPQKQEQDKNDEKVQECKYKNGDYNRKARVTASSLRVRGGRPGQANYDKVLTKLPKGTEVIVNYCLNGWFSIYIKEANPGFICGDYIELL